MQILLSVGTTTVPTHRAALMQSIGRKGRWESRELETRATAKGADKPCQSGIADNSSRVSEEIHDAAPYCQLTSERQTHNFKPVRQLPGRCKRTRIDDIDFDLYPQT